MTPTVSVIIPTHNRAESVKRAVESVFAQTFTDFEIVVVDDGSTDDTRDTLTGYPSRLRYVWQQNQGPAAARNHGMRLARGEYVGFLDSDDVHYPEHLEAHLEKFAEAPDAGLVYAGSEIVDHDGTLIKEFRPDPTHRGDVLEHLVLHNFIIPSTVLMTRSCMEFAGGMNTQLWFAEDWYYWMRIASRYQIEYVDRVLVRYQRTRGSLSHGKPISELAARNIEMFNLAFADRDLAKAIAPFRRRAYCTAYANYASMALEEYQLGLARRLATKAIAARPSQSEPYALFLKSLLGARALRWIRRFRRGA
jgi:glycosyltransferase involved in cell wall biosynthesis